MKFSRNARNKTFLTIGLIFLVVGFAAQGFTFSLESGLFNLGLIFTLAGLAAVGMDRFRPSGPAE